MANKNLFKSTATVVPVADTRNLAGGLAYSATDEQAAAQFAATGTFNNTYYASAKTQLDAFKKHLVNCNSDFLARLALYARHSAFMKDTPAFILATLVSRGDLDLVKRTLPTVLSNGRMVRTFVQIIRSGVTGRRSLGTSTKNLLIKWIQDRNFDSLFRDNVGNDPSMADVIKLTHPKPKSVEQNALFQYLMGKEYDKNLLPGLAKEFEDFKANPVGPVPDVPINQLSSFNLSEAQWTEKFLQLPWQATRMNLATAQRHGVFNSKDAVQATAKKLSNPELIAKAKVFPYDLLKAFRFGCDGLPRAVTQAIHDALDISTQNIPEIEGGVLIAVDSSGSMGSALDAKGRPTYNSNSIKLTEIAALMASCILRKSDDVDIVSFDHNLHLVNISAHDSVLTNAGRFPTAGGSTNVALPLEHWNKLNKRAKTVIIISDNEANINGSSGFWGRTAHTTSTAEAWAAYKKRVKGAKLVCINLTPNSTQQVKTGPDVLNIGGFSDAVFGVISSFAASKDADHWVNHIKSIAIP